MYGLYIAFSERAIRAVEEFGFDRHIMEEIGLVQDFDWKYKEFQTTGERSAYIDGIRDSNGWTQDAYWEHVHKEIKQQS